ncbi:MAG: NADH:ubiquinone reductase (Na(+)-transporting) subunit B [Flavobacteriales bacterium]|nr:NADH:ubiquinone reductase (Na(+)-transporting) subunit B [Flavobacteriales bacterium]
MKALHKFIEKNIKPIFDEGGKLEKFYPVYDGLETFLFVPGHATNKGAHIRDGIDLKRTMITVVIALLPCLLFGMWNTGHWHYAAQGLMEGTGEGMMEKFMFGLMKVLPVVVVSYGVGLGIEFTFCVIKKHSIEEGFLVSGMLIPLCIPADTPLWMVAIATAFAVVFGKEVFGGTGMNILNPALTARAFLFFAYPTKMSGTDVWNADPTMLTSNPGNLAVGGVDAVSGATALGEAAENMPIDQFTSSFSIMDSFFGFIPGSIGETSALACLLGAAVLLYTGIGSWRIMLSMFVGGYAMGAIFNAFGNNTLMQIEPIHHLLIGGFMFGMVFMATDPVSAAQTATGKIIYGFFCGFFGIMIRVFNPAYPEGVMLAILFMNVMAPLIDHYVVQANIKRRLKRLKTVKA